MYYIIVLFSKKVKFKQKDGHLQITKDINHWCVGIVDFINEMKTDTDHDPNLFSSWMRNLIQICAQFFDLCWEHIQAKGGGQYKIILECHNSVKKMSLTYF